MTDDNEVLLLQDFFYYLQIIEATMAQSRQLAAIMFTDIVGYTSLMQKDEAAALDKLHRFKEELSLGTKLHRGEIIQYYGDGCLIIFPNSNDAVSCAKSLQEAFRDKLDIPVRIGIHLGDILIEDGNIFGDSVNISSRIESMGVPGSVLVSDAIRNQIKNKSEFILSTLGKFEFKNVEEPMEIFALSNSGFTIPKKSELEGKFKETKTEKYVKDLPVAKKKNILLLLLGLIILLTAGYIIFSNTIRKSNNNQVTSEKILEKSIAVLPFVNMSSDPQQEYFSDGLSEELINMFTKLPGLKVIGRTSSFVFKGKNEDLVNIGKKLGVAYILEGSVRKSGNTLRITAQLIKASDGTHLWSETYDREMNDIFIVQREISRMIAQKFEIEISPEANAKIDQTPTKNIEAYDQFQKGYFFMYKKFVNTQDDEDFQKAKKFFEKAIELDPNYAEAYAGLAEVYDELRNKIGKEFPKELLILKEQLARKAFQLKPNSPFVNTAMAYAILHRDVPDFDSGFYFLKKAYNLDPNDPLNNMNLSQRLSIHIGLHSSAIPFSLNAIKADPLEPNIYPLLGLQYLNLGKNTEAKETFQKCIDLTNDKFNTEWALLYGLIYFGEYEKAEKRLNRMDTGMDQSVLKAYLHAAKGEIDKVKPEFRNNLNVLLVTNRNKILKDVIKRIETAIDEGYNTWESNYSFLSTSFYFDAYRNDPDFKRVLEKARKNQEAKMQKYGNIEMPD
jgi:TolB-like protein/class 3 adenylate cyclase/Flp pilus assembly protein TadD